MILPAIFDHQLYASNQAPPQLGEQCRWHLFWNANFANYWAGLSEDWGLATTMRAREDSHPTKLSGERQVRLPAIASSGSVQINCHVYESVPDSLVLTGAVRIAGRSERDAPAQSARPAVLATVTRLRLVSVVYDLRPSVNIEAPNADRQWETLQPIAGTEWFYELARAPLSLHTYRPRENEPGQLRQELLLLDLDTSN